MTSTITPIADAIIYPSGERSAWSNQKLVNQLTHEQLFTFQRTGKRWPQTTFRREKRSDGSTKITMMVIEGSPPPLAFTSL